MSMLDKQDYGEIEAQTKCASVLSFKAELEMRINNTKAKLKQQERLLELLNENPNFEELITLARRF